MSEAVIRERYEAAGQGHVLDFVVDLEDSEKQALLTQLDEIPVELLDGYLKAAMAETSSSTSIDDISPFVGSVGRTTDTKLVEDSYGVGMGAIRRGEVATLVLAGGQGTRLGYDGPKGMYNIGLPSGKSLFQLMAERIRKLTQLAGGETVIPFFIMTSPLNHDETVQFWDSHNYFDLGRENVKLFQQGMLPCLTEDGKIIMETAYQVAMAPDGNGGIYPALVSSGSLDEMTARGIKYLHIFSIDNALVRPADPVFMGYCMNQGADLGNKVVWKAHPDEQVGVIATRAGKPCIVEYSEISSEMAERKDATGRLVFGAANICNHFYTLEFIREKILPNLGNMYHIARKKIKYYDGEKKETITPTSNTGIKLESFIFDVFQLSEKMVVLDTQRSEEFSPVKNKPGSESDSPDTARAMISALAKKWVRAAGGRLIHEHDVEDDETLISEISSLTSYGGEGLESLVNGKDITCPFSF